jgi:hypothetical protein
MGKNPMKGHPQKFIRSQVGLLPTNCSLLLDESARTWIVATSTKNPNGFPDKLKKTLRLDRLPVGVRRVVIGIVGAGVLVAGIAMIFLPGPAFIMIPLGLAILATEFSWARRWLHKAQAWFKSKSRALRRKRAST